MTNVIPIAYSFLAEHNPSVRTRDRKRPSFLINPWDYVDYPLSLYEAESRAAEEILAARKITVKTKITERTTRRQLLQFQRGAGAD